MHSTNYHSSFITVSPDSTCRAGTVPGKPDSIADLQYSLITSHPYAHTSDDVLYLVQVRRGEIRKPSGPIQSRAEFFSKAHACLRTSPLARQYGWGIHHDQDGRVALVGVETARYAEFERDPALKVVPAMRKSRA